MRFECCLDARGESQYMRSIHGHSGVPEVNFKNCMSLEIPCEMKFTSIEQDLRTITHQSSKEDRSQEAPVIAEEDKHVCS